MEKKKKLPKGIAARLKMIGLLVAASAVFFLPTTILVIIGMLPTIAAAAIDNTKAKSLMLSVGILNLAGCLPFVIELWETGHNTQNAVQIAVQVRTILVIYLIAALGYVIDFIVTQIVSNLLLQKAQNRIKKIEKIQNELRDRWGTKVDGKIALDADGFPIVNEPTEQQAP